MEALHLGFLQRIEQDMQFTYHLKCESSKVFQLGFADDLLLFCRADFDAIRVFKEGLEWFAELSGLWLNVQKNHLIISRSAQELKDQMLEILGFQEGHLQMRYLGLPLISSTLSISDCQPLISKIDARITGWEGISLSYAGRVQITKSVLSTLSLYWASAFILPKKVIKEIEKRLRNFLWKGTTSCGYAKVAWKDVCRPADEGGLGFKDISTLNRALMSKKLCDIIQTHQFGLVREYGGSWGWRKILRLRPFLRSIVDYQIGNGGRFFVWQDPWHHLGPIIERFPRGPRHLRLEESAKMNLRMRYVAVRDLNEVCGISGDIRMAMEEFNAGIQEAGLLPLPMQGEWYTWHNCSTTPRSLWKRLDRILINDRWLARFPTSSYHCLTPQTSDHSPLVLHGDTQQQNGGMFRFDNYLAHSPDFIPSVQNIWQHEVVGVPMYAVSRKLKALKPVFRQQRWNKGDLTLNVQLAKGFLEEAQNMVTSDRQNELFLFLEHCCRLV
ncbi:UNVERIFIED_CONTAM: putative ribonuclease H protein [Sesamum indicum]